MKYKKLKGAKIALVAMGKSQVNFAMALAFSQKFDEVWTINATAGIYKTNRMFMMDPPERFLDGEQAGGQTGIVSEVISSKQNFPIYSCTVDERCPSVEKYPIEEVIRTTGCSYLNNTAAYALAYALYQEVGELAIYGIDFSYSQAVHFAEAGRGCCEFWCGLICAKGIKLSIAPDSPFMDANIPPHQKLYGYHRLDDPPHVSVTEEGVINIQPLSSITQAPEPADADELYRG